VNLPARFPPHLSTHATLGKTSCAAHGVCTPRAINPDADKGARSPLVSQLGSTNWYPEEAKCSTDVTRSAWQSHRFRNRSSDCLGSHDAHCAVTGPYHLGTATVARSSVMTFRHDASIRCALLSNGIDTLSHQQSRLSFRKNARGKRC
jgi:hypothetical protein